MANILGRKLLELSDDYKNNKEEYKTFDNFFLRNMSKHLDFNEYALKLLNDEFKELLESIDSDTTDDDIVAMLDGVKHKIVSYDCIHNSIDILEVIGLYLSFQLKYNDES